MMLWLNQSELYPRICFGVIRKRGRIHQEHGERQANMMKKHFTLATALLLTVCVFLLSGCAGRIDIAEKQTALSQTIPPGWHEPFAVVGSAANLEELTDIPELQQLVQEALENNPDITATAYRLKASGLLLTNVSSTLLPSVTVGGTGTRTNSGGTPADSYSASANLS